MAAETVRQVNWGRWAPALASLALVLFPLVVPNPYLHRVGVLVLMNFVLVLGYHVILNLAGLFHLGYTAYFAIGAYAGALLTLHYAVPFWVLLVLVPAFTALFSVLSGVLLLRFRGDYFAVATLALAECIRLLSQNWMSLTRGPVGLYNITRPTWAGTPITQPASYYYIILVLAVLAFLAVNRLVHSPVGLGWSLVRENEDAAAALGVSTFALKQYALAVGAALAAAAGVFFAHYQTFIDPSVGALNNTITLLAMVILSGGGLAGLMLSGTVLTVLPEVLRTVVLWRMFLLGCLFVVLMNARPEGLRAPVGGHLEHLLPARRKEAGA